MAINYQGKITVKDLRKAIYKNFSKLYLRIWVSLLVLIILFELYLLVKYSLSAFPFFFWISIPVIFSMPFWLPYFEAQRANQKGSIYYSPIHGVVDEKGILLENSEVKIETVWSSYDRYKIDDELVLLYKGKFRAGIFSSALFANQKDWKNFQKLVQENIHQHNAGTIGTENTK